MTNRQYNNNWLVKCKRIRILGDIMLYILVGFMVINFLIYKLTNKTIEVKKVYSFECYYINVNDVKIEKVEVIQIKQKDKKRNDNYKIVDKVKTQIPPQKTSDYLDEYKIRMELRDKYFNNQISYEDLLKECNKLQILISDIIS